MDYRRGVITPHSVWRALILYGANSATYKFAFGLTLLDAAKAGRTTVSLADIAPRYAALICEALEREPRQGTAARSKFLDACRAFNVGEISESDLSEVTVRHGFVNVVDAFPRLRMEEASIKYYEDRRRDSSVRGLVLTDELLGLAEPTVST